MCFTDPFARVTKAQWTPFALSHRQKKVSQSCAERHRFRRVYEGGSQRASSDKKDPSFDLFTLMIVSRWKVLLLQHLNTPFCVKNAFHVALK